MDGNNQIILIATGVFQGETNESWTCDKLKGLYWKTCKAYTIEEFQKLISKIQSVRPDAHIKLFEVGFSKWSRSLCPATRYNYMISNIGELVNALTKDVRKLPITMIMDWYRYRLQKWYYERRDKHEDAPDDELTEWATMKVNARMLKSANWNVTGFKSTHDPSANKESQAHQEHHEPNSDFNLQMMYEPQPETNNMDDMYQMQQELSYPYSNTNTESLERRSLSNIPPSTHPFETFSDNAFDSRLEDTCNFNETWEPKKLLKITSKSDLKDDQRSVFYVKPGTSSIYCKGKKASSSKKGSCSKTTNTIPSNVLKFYDDSSSDDDRTVLTCKPRSRLKSVRVTKHSSSKKGKLSSCYKTVEADVRVIAVSLYDVVEAKKNYL
nr:transposase, MuDR, MULE transposase domain protein [Tanacetum cinerariifolium]